MMASEGDEFTGGQRQILQAVDDVIGTARTPLVKGLVDEAPRAERYDYPSQRGQDRQVRLLDAYVLGLSPFGLFGVHHLYLRRIGFFVFYLLTVGNCGIGWIVDWFRMNWLVYRVNNPPVRRTKHLDDAYILAFPFGFLGLHHFYLGRKNFGLLYLFTFGLFGVGVMVDLVRMFWLVKDANDQLERDLPPADCVICTCCAGCCGPCCTPDCTAGTCCAGCCGHCCTPGSED